MDVAEISELRARVCVEALASLRTIARESTDVVAVSVAVEAIHQCGKILAPLVVIPDERDEA